LSAFASSGIAPVDPDPAAHYASVLGVWPELYAAFLVLLVAFLALMPSALRSGIGLDLHGRAPSWYLPLSLARRSWACSLRRSDDTGIR